ncbi:Kunitz/Bovine pancreatic trypsin inhibitor domain protein [Ancylostoma caninum]|uniref:Kunitz/Bovine pancreatic trypsin inhibitor domain protein n=1 Tax=Ancylostoma caninum TaxID=29170 RepID=A0A368F230_ANCCA|nr:Kunitz/Bovine pancreatic trypsin inhibitor domain protein [Ancylostoma caninum]
MGLPKCEKGEPLKTKLGVTVNCAKSDCPSGYKCSIVQQTSVCCPENDKIIGLQTSNPSDVCSMPKERGPCDKYELRFYFNAEVKECKYFFWGGCEGNGNNFEKVEECESACGIAKVKESLPTSTRPTTANNRQPHFRTTQGIRITPGGGVRNEETLAQESTTTSVTATAPTAAPLPSRHSPPAAPTTLSRPFEGQSTSDTTDSTTAATSVHVAPTRAPPIPQMALLEGSEESQAEGGNNALLNPVFNQSYTHATRAPTIRWFPSHQHPVMFVSGRNTRVATRGFGSRVTCSGFTSRYPLE